MQLLCEKFLDRISIQAQTRNNNILENSETINGLALQYTGRKTPKRIIYPQKNVAFFASF
jgi:hypothetical protein